MRRVTKRCAAKALVGVLGLASSHDKSHAAQRIRSRWQSLPATPSLPTQGRSSLADINGTNIFYAQFGAGAPLLFLHGGLANSNYWGRQIEAFSRDYLVLAMDTRGHGRSAATSEAFSYDLFARDVIALLDLLHLPKVTVIGWSDGAITGLQLAITAKERINKLFAFGANVSVGGLRKGGSASSVFSEYVARCKDEYETLSPHPERWHVLVDGLRSMWRSSPNFTARELDRIIAPTTISDGMYDEVIRSGHSKEIADKIPGAKLVMQQEVSHFAMLQDSRQFNQAVSEFLRS
jgi:pimeloyl-ACP methyl ester carboxylesterase